MSERSTDTHRSLVVEPTLTADEMQAGNAGASGSPSFPAAVTVGMPTDLRLSMRAVICGSSVSHADEKASPPRLMLAAAMAYWVRISYTNSSPAPMSLVNARAHGIDSKNGMQSETELRKTWTGDEPGALRDAGEAHPHGCPRSRRRSPATCVP